MVLVEDFSRIIVFYTQRYRFNSCVASSVVKLAYSLALEGVRYLVTKSLVHSAEGDASLRSRLIKILLL